ncbi:phosphotransferase [Streptomyces sp. NPDC005538]|uniref:phosphotransferase n=1 Tax=unclassified Streptomyces TaxID=2593676 RepID=UPI0033A5D070
MGTPGDPDIPSLSSLLAHAPEPRQAANGYHNQSYVLTVTDDDMARLVKRPVGTSVLLRRRRAHALAVVIRTWRDEAAILDAVGAVLPHVPQCLMRSREFTIHSYVDGVPLSSVCADGEPVDSRLVTELAALLAGMARVRRDALPPLPSAWPSDDTDSQELLRTLVDQADRQIRRPNQAAFGGLFAALGVPDDALARFRERVPLMTRRPYSLLHADLHRDNLILPYAGEPPLICVDWELATYGDPLHDLATHLVRMRYPHHQWAELTGAWEEAMARVRPAAVRGYAEDLRHYLDFERAQSVYPDVMRAAQSLLPEDLAPSRLEAAVPAVSRALEAAAEPLRLRHLPEPGEIERILLRWRTSRLTAREG